VIREVSLAVFTIQNEVVSEKWMAIKRLKMGDSQLAQSVSEVEESQGQFREDVFSGPVWIDGA
jgi:hypothetical protein